VAATKEAASSTVAIAQAFTRHPRLTMRTPTKAQVRTAIEVLKKLEERIDNHATFNMMQLPESRGGDDAAAPIEAHTSEQISRVKTVMAQLESWRDELRQDRRHCVAQHV
jgi:hypothetical protein